MDVLTRFSTANVRHTLSAARAIADLRAVQEVSDIICVQEVSRRNVTELAGEGWGVAQARRSGPEASNAVLWRSDRFVPTASGSPLLHISRLFTSATRWMTWVRLFDELTGRTFTVVSVHMVPHADDGKGGITTRPRRRLVLAALGIVTAFARATRRQLVIAGDFNVDLAADLRHANPNDLAEQFHRAGLMASVEVLGVPRDTHGGGLYDQIWFRLVGAGSAIGLVRHHVHPKRNSDHRAYTVQARVTTRDDRGR